MRSEKKERLGDLARRASHHFEAIEQDVPDEAFVVGGAVRDALLGREASDLDFVVVGETPASMVARGFENIEASSFPVFHDSEREEWALARTEQKAGAGYKGFEVETEDVSLEQDLKRRDLTINAMALDPRNGKSQDDMRSKYVVPFGAREEWTLIDPYAGRFDVEDELLRAVSSAFSDDPLRVVRTARYAARFDFSVVHGTMERMRKISHRLNLVSRDRIGTEIVKALEQAEHPDRFFEVLRDSGALAVLIPELDRAQIVPAGPQEHHAEGDTFRHTMRVLDRMDRLCDERGVEGEERVDRLLMVLAHDLGKVPIADEMGGLHSDEPPRHFGGHADRGTDVVDRLADRLGLSGHHRTIMAEACRRHMDVHDLPEMPAEEVLTFLDELRVAPEKLIDLAHADQEGRICLDDQGDEYVPTFDRDRFEQVLDAYDEATVDGLDVLENGACDEHEGDVRGDDNPHSLMTKCDECRTPGPWVGAEIDTRRSELLREELPEGEGVSDR